MSGFGTLNQPHIRSMVCLAGSGAVTVGVPLAILFGGFIGVCGAIVGASYMAVICACCRVAGRADDGRWH